MLILWDHDNIVNRYRHNNPIWVGGIGRLPWTDLFERLITRIIGRLATENPILHKRLGFRFEKNTDEKKASETEVCDPKSTRVLISPYSYLTIRANLSFWLCWSAYIESNKKRCAGSRYTYYYYVSGKANYADSKPGKKYHDFTHEDEINAFIVYLIF